MTDLIAIKDRLRHFAEHIERWKAEAAQLRTQAESASTSNPADTESLVHLESTASDIYDEISSFKQTVNEVAALSPEAAGELASVGEALHLLLLDITELGIKMYSTRSPEVVEQPELAPAPAKMVPIPAQIESMQPQRGPTAGRPGRPFSAGQRRTAAEPVNQTNQLGWVMLAGLAAYAVSLSLRERPRPRP